MHVALGQQQSIEKLQSDIIVDDLSSDFTRYSDVGDVNAHFISSEINDVTHASHAYWADTYDVRNIAFFNLRAEWTPFFPASGEYEVSAFIPSVQTGHADTSCAKYEVSHRGGVSQVTVDQAAHTGEWVVLGKYNFDKSSVAAELLGSDGAAASVKLGYETCDNPGPTILYDAIRFRPTVTVDPRPSVSIDGGCGQTFSPGARMTVRYSANVSEYYQLIVYRDPDFPAAHFVMNHGGTAGTTYTYETTADSTTKQGRFVLRLSDSGIDSSPCRYDVAIRPTSPPPTATRQPTSTRAPSGSVSGHVTTRGWAPLVEAREPVILARMDLVRENGTIAATTETNQSGDYVFGGVEPDKQLAVRLRFESRDGTNKVCWRNVSNCSKSLSVSSARFNILTGEARTVNLDLSSASLTIDAPDDAAKNSIASMAWVHTLAVRVQIYREEVLGNHGRKLGSIVVASDQVTANQPKYISPSVHLGSDVLNPRHEQDNIWWWTNPRRAIYHEVFHFVMHDSINLPPNRGGNHQGYCNSSTADSWAEGWADFWAAALDDHLGNPLPASYLPFYMHLGTVNYQAFDSYNATFCTDNPETAPNEIANNTSKEDTAVASLLWDLYDGADFVDRGDLVDLSARSLWVALVGTGEPLSQRDKLKDMKDVYDTLTRQSLKNENGSPVVLSDIERMFEVHGFFSDDNDNRKLDRGEGEQVGYTGDSKRPNRRFRLMPTNAYIRVLLPDSQPQSEETSIVVTVDYGKVRESYSMPVSSDRDVKVPVETPGDSVPVRITVHAVMGAITTAAYTIQGSDYSSLVMQSPLSRGYALAITLHRDPSWSPGRYSRLYMPVFSKGNLLVDRPTKTPTKVPTGTRVVSSVTPRLPTVTPTRAASWSAESRLGWQTLPLSFDPHQMDDPDIPNGAPIWANFEVVRGGWTHDSGTVPLNSGTGGANPRICDPQGRGLQCAEPLPSAATGSLIGMIDEPTIGPDLFFIGAAREEIIGRAGRFSVRINEGDAGLTNNQGSLVVGFFVGTGVLARAGWQRTGIIVDAGQQIRVTVSSSRTWTHDLGVVAPNPGTGGSVVCDPNRRGLQCSEPLPSAPTGSLIGRIGNQIQAIGAQNTISSGLGGVLALRINEADTLLEDNDGSVAVLIEINR